ncbi:GNAT family N-acetyltransferase [Microterricola viridarii]|uniref:GNAT family N-acetyltransferase n=1 Tax=Microterricola viridarii TaxID=412690 RepID=UPI0009E916FF|nr:GNAT family N-acetyltransferase [Microterricola viridarii]
MSEIAPVRIVSVSDAPWADVERVFGTRGDPATCWCQFFKLSNEEWKNAEASACKTALEQQVRVAAPPPGVIAYRGDEAVGWCAVEPRVNYGRLMRTRVVAGGSPESPDDEGVWAVTCFVVRVGHRRRGVGGELLRGAIEQARALGAEAIEGYPVDVAVRGKTSSADLYHGTLTQFLAAGFEEVARPSADRPVMQLHFAR